MISTQLLDALELSRQTMKTVKQNLWWAFGYNIVSCSAFSYFALLGCEFLMSECLLFLKTYTGRDPSCSWSVAAIDWNHVDSINGGGSHGCELSWRHD